MPSASLPSKSYSTVAVNKNAVFFLEGAPGLEGVAGCVGEGVEVDAGVVVGVEVDVGVGAGFALGELMAPTKTT